ncbi:c-type cytochrome [Pseudochrobactrum kiredjianiae]|uniref:C-type cytochrome n=1 Tax=Pseudochrobactrum kiredjianiae TaxID=386305 RepID=A0ABW3V6L6_9HYPH|nr:cytochrome c family protein [Pseudochrobactrum kiredjianiae]MDM7849702.1 cytochrome c family protein [Pseudochrobactrum kiredjianiae]
MNSSQSNKYIMAFLATVFIAMTIGISSDAIFSTPHPEAEGYVIAASEGGAPAAGKEAPAAVPIATLLASADPARGQNVFKRCAACHTGEKGGANKVGPHLWDVVNRPMATVEGFSYSAAMKEFSQGGKEVWDYEHLNKFLTSPKGYIKGTAMGFAGDKKDNERADLIAYLRSLSDNPAPLPSPEAAAPAEATKPAEEAKPADEKPAEAPVAPETPAPAAPEAPATQPAN